MPPLRERENDVSLLAESFLHDFAAENNKVFKPLSERALQMLCQYSWPGNVRELRTTIEHGVVMSNEDTIRLNHLPSRIQVNEAIHRDPAIDCIPSSTATIPVPTTRPSSDELLNLAEIEKLTIIKALKQTNGNRTEAANLLGISRRTLHRKLNTFTMP